MPRLVANALVVLLCPTLLEAHYFWRRVGQSQLPPNLGETFMAILGDEFQTPAIKGQNSNVSRRLTWREKRPFEPRTAKLQFNRQAAVEGSCRLSIGDVTEWQSRSPPSDTRFGFLFAQLRSNSKRRVCLAITRCVSASIFSWIVRVPEHVGESHAMRPP